MIFFCWTLRFLLIGVAGCRRFQNIIWAFLGSGVEVAQVELVVQLVLRVFGFLVNGQKDWVGELGGMNYQLPILFRARCVSLYLVYHF